jgi:general nucleoside transport system permease protein
MMVAIAWIYQLRTLFAVLVALGLGALLMLLVGANPLNAYQTLIRESFFDYYGFANTLVKTSPILLAGLAVLLPLRAGVYNIGGEGQIYLGGLFGTLVGLALPDVPSAIGIPAVMLGAMLGGAFWAAIPAILRAYRGINEVIVGLLLNFVGIQLVSFAVSGPLLAASAPYPYSEELAQSLHLPRIMARTDAHIGVIVAVLLSILVYAYFRYTRGGFAMQTIGHSPEAARYAGISVPAQILKSMMLGGAVAGLAGGIEVIGVKYRLFHMFSGGYGYDGIVAAFIAVGSPLILPFVALFLAALKAGAGAMERGAGIERSVVDAIQGLVVILVAAGLAIRNPGLSTLLSKSPPTPQHPGEPVRQESQAMPKEIA